MYWLPLAALALDLLLPDPQRLPHPVQAIGWLANLLEKRIRRLPSPVIAGAMALAAIVILTGWAAFMLTILPSGIGLCMSVYLAWAGLALGTLLRAGKKALASLCRVEENPDSLLIFQARRDVQMLVSRDTSGMDTGDLYRSLAESISENFNDAFVAPFFWLCLGGPVGLWIYKAVSTMDSMWGYRNARWEKLGKASARLDDVLAYLPARLAAFFLFLADRLAHAPAARRRSPQSARENTKSSWPGWKTVIREAGQSASPNAGWPMATAAWLCGGKTGGPTPYDGTMVNKPVMGPKSGAWRYDNTAALLALTRRAGVLGGLALACGTLLGVFA